jgi:hypothetical protein
VLFRPLGPPFLLPAIDCPNDSAARMSAPLAICESASFCRLGGRGDGSRLEGRDRDSRGLTGRFRGSRSVSERAGAFSLAIMACTAAAARLATPEPAKAARSGEGPRSFSAAAGAEASSF